MADSQSLFRETFVNAPGRLTFTPTEEQARETRLFILDGPEYRRLKNYVNKGAQAPATLEELVAKFGYIFQRGRKLQELVQVMQDIHHHCSAFKENSLGTYVTLAEDTVKFCDMVARFISGRGLIQDQLSTLAEMEMDIGSQGGVDAARSMLADIGAEGERLEHIAETLQQNLSLFIGLTRDDLRRLKAADEFTDRIRRALPPYSSTMYNRGPAWDLVNSGQMGLLLDNELHVMRGMGSLTLDAVGTMTSTFGRISSNIREIQSKSGPISTALGNEDPFERELAQTDLDAAIAKWHELYVLTTAFLKATRPLTPWQRLAAMRDRISRTRSRL